MLVSFFVAQASRQIKMDEAVKSREDEGSKTL